MDKPNRRRNYQDFFLYLTHPWVKTAEHIGMKTLDRFNYNPTIGFVHFYPCWLLYLFMI